MYFTVPKLNIISVALILFDLTQFINWVMQIKENRHKQCIQNALHNKTEKWNETKIQ